MKMFAISDSVEGKIAAAPMPMNARAAINWFGVDASAPRQAPCSEDRQAGEQHAFAPEAVAQAAGRKDEGGEYQAVGIDHPLELGRGRAELAHQ